jgi:hypothetical protein
LENPGHVRRELTTLEQALPALHALTTLLATSPAVLPNPPSRE